MEALTAAGSCRSRLNESGKMNDLNTLFPVREWRRSECAVFSKVAEAHGGCSNMAGGFPITLNGVAIRTSEALYQAMRFPDHPEVQAQIIEQKSPMAAKMVGKPHLHLTRPDWNEVRVFVMAWAIRMKLVQNIQSFGAVLTGTGSRDIVEQSHKDDFWGAKGNAVLVGRNVLGLLLTDLREQWANDQLGVPSPPCDGMYLLGEPLSAA
jgi:ribA/ribD-fused uncharacterized protein